MVYACAYVHGVCAWCLRTYLHGGSGDGGGDLDSGGGGAYHQRAVGKWCAAAAVGGDSGGGGFGTSLPSPFAHPYRYHHRQPSS